MPNGLIRPIAIGLAVGITLIVVFVIYSANPTTPNDIPKEPKNVTVVPPSNVTANVTVVIPSNANGTYPNYQPPGISVIIGINNTVKWINENNVPETVVTDNPWLENFTTLGSVPGGYLLPNQTYSHTFTKIGVFGYHGEPHPWLHGVVIVLPADKNGLNPVTCKQSTYCTYQYQSHNGTFPINFRFNGTIENVTVTGQPTNGSMTILVNPSKDGTLQIALPKAVLNSRPYESDDQFAIFINGMNSDYDEYQDKAQDLGISTDQLQDYRILTIPIEKDSRFVEIVPTVPI